MRLRVAGVGKDEPGPGAGRECRAPLRPDRADARVLRGGEVGAAGRRDEPDAATGRRINDNGGMPDVDALRSQDLATSQLENMPGGSGGAPADVRGCVGAHDGHHVGGWVGGVGRRRGEPRRVNPGGHAQLLAVPARLR